MRLVNIGFGNMVAAERIVSVIAPDSAPVKRTIQDVRERGMLIDATYGRKTQAVIITDSGHLLLSALSPSAVAQRINGRPDPYSGGEDDE